MELDFLTESIIKVVAGAVCGGLLGLERKSHNQVIGMRTLILICVSSTLLSILSVHMAKAEGFIATAKGDPTRIAAGVVSGIGFLGGGAIMNQGLHIKGHTSAAKIWTATPYGQANGLIVADMNMSRIIKTKQIILHYLVKSPTEYDFSALIKSLEELGNLSEFSITD